MGIDEYFGSWSKVVPLQQADSIMRSLPSDICPSHKNVFKAFRLCPMNQLRVVILGMDPYNDYYGGKPRATGVAFANAKDTPEEHYSPSLDVLRESIIDFSIPHEPIIFDPSLENWENQGVLLLNSALTCLRNQPGSHALLWRPFMRSLLNNLSCHTTGIVYVLMGNDAQSFEHCINPQFNHIIKVKHPAWYARKQERMPDVWSEINKILIGQNGYGIEWYQLKH